MNARTTLNAMLAGSPFQSYAYGYPHKTAYRPFDMPLPLTDIWRDAPADDLDLYLHIPFCAMRCGFCNLFTSVGADADAMSAFVRQLQTEIATVRAAIGERAFARMAIGGGTPTALDAKHLDAVFTALDDAFSARPVRVPTSVEASPETTTAEKLAILRARGVSRLSLGVQSFLPAETKALGRPQQRAVVEHALRLITDAGFETISIDLIYGAAGQTTTSFLVSIDAALAWQPHEIFLYPLYVRPLTGLARIGVRTEDRADIRLSIYRAARDRLLERGYEQVSLRHFRRSQPNAAKHQIHHGMTRGTLGLGCGARSETPALHYSSDYAVGRNGVREIIANYVAQPAEQLAVAPFGVRLSDDDQRRRFILLPLLQAPGLSRTAYRARFGADVLDDMPALTLLVESGLATLDPERIELTQSGYERADTIGPWLYSTAITERMRSYAWR